MYIYTGHKIAQMLRYWACRRILLSPKIGQLANGDETDCEVNWGGKDLEPFVGRKIRLHIEIDNATNL